MRVVTIAARNYLSRIEVLAESYAAHHPGDRLVALLVDAEPGEVHSTTNLDVRTPGDLPLTSDDFGRMAMIYNVTELSTALKPWALEMLLNEGAESVLYLDPDIEVFHHLAWIGELAVENGIVLTPHTTVPFPRDGLDPSEADIMHAGIYNLGFIGVSGDSRPFLSWWQERLRRDCLIDLPSALFVDQRWVDQVPGLFAHLILKDAGCNVAYWNLHGRVVEGGREAGYRVNGVPLQFFHYSGYLPDQPHMLSKYSPRPRNLMSKLPAVAQLCADYGHRVLAHDRDLPRYALDRLQDGTQLSTVLRRWYRDVLIRAERSGDDLPPVPFVGDDEAVVRWLGAPVAPGSRISNAMHALWFSRPDLRAAFPDPTGRNEQEFALWCNTWWAAHPDMDGRFLLRTGKQTRLAGRGVVDERGVNLAGYFTVESGVGQLGRLLVESARHAGIPLSTTLNRESVSRQGAEFVETTSDVVYPVTIASVNADQFPIWASTTGATLASGTYVIGVWAWELDTFPDYSAAFELVHEVWAISEFSRDAIASRTTKPVHVVPLPSPTPPARQPLSGAVGHLAAAPYFLFMFDYLSIFERKNPLAVVEAFSAAFPEGSGPRLVIKASNGDRVAAKLEQLRIACASRSDIVLVEGYLTSDELNALQWNATAYVSLHRAEGYGLTISEAMARGVPVIATEYAGSMQFTTPDVALLVPYELVPIGPGAEPYDPEGRWAEPDVGVAAQHMRWVVDHPDEARELGERGREWISETFTFDVTAAFIRERLDAGLQAWRGSIAGVASPGRRLPQLALRARTVGLLRRTAFFADRHYFAKHPGSRARVAALVGRSHRLRAIFAPHLNGSGSAWHRG